jgi:hypothetical protein
VPIRLCSQSTARSFGLRNRKRAKHLQACPSGKLNAKRVEGAVLDTVMRDVLTLENL